MESNSIYELVGGITRVVLHLTATPLPEVAEIGEGLEVTLDLGKSSYSQRRYLEAGSYRVQHTLSFELLPTESPFTDVQMTRALSEGVVADLTLASGQLIRVGWSERYGVEFPLRLESAEFLSGEEATDYPLQRWIWSSTDRDCVI